jgi:hypothetical protein
MNTITQSQLNKIAQLEERSLAKVAAARSTVGKGYHNHLLLLEQNQKLWRTKELSEEDCQALTASGAWFKLDPDGLFTIYARTTVPYLSVEGRLRMFLDDLGERDLTFTMSQEIDWYHQVLHVTVSCPWGTAVGSARIVEGGSGVDATHPLEKAQTSALGRALGFLGYGLFQGNAGEEEEKPPPQPEPPPPPPPASGGKDPLALLPPEQPRFRHSASHGKPFPPLPMASLSPRPSGRG